MAIDDLSPGTLGRAEPQAACWCGSRECAQVLDPDRWGDFLGFPIVVDHRLPPNVAALVGPDGDAYVFSIGEPTLDNCTRCRGTGEINEFPADDDERLVACPVCGGTGEVFN